jgi:thymidylate kinase
LREELATLEGVVRRSEVANAVHSVPGLDLALFDRCVASFQPACPLWKRVAVRFELERRLAAHGSGGSTGVALLRGAGRRFVRRVLPAVSAANGGGKQLAAGGAVIALVGADGSGKSTCARILRDWLGRELRAGHAHVGRPPRTALTLALGAALKLGRRFKGLLGPRVVAQLELLRVAGTARDRYRLARRAGRFAAQGGVMICERYPIEQNRALVGPSGAQGIALAARGRFADWLRRYEAACYSRISPPDLVLFLSIEPEEAVARKREEPSEYVRRRARLLRDADWSAANARTIEAGRPLDEVASELRARIWEAL